MMRRLFLWVIGSTLLGLMVPSLALAATPVLAASCTEVGSPIGTPVHAGWVTEMGQSFTAIEGTLDSVQFYLDRTGSPSGDVYAVLYAHSGTYGTSSEPTGTPLAVSAPVASSSIPTSPRSLVKFSFDNTLSLEAGENYVIAIRHTAGDDNNYVTGWLNFGSAHAGNRSEFQNSTWSVVNWDLVFYLYEMEPAAPVVSTTAASPVSWNSAISGGNVTADAGAPVTARGVCWSTSADPSITDSCTTDGGGTGVFSSSIVGLSPDTLYHVRAYATNAIDTAYGSDLTFTTDPAPARMQPVHRFFNMKGGVHFYTADNAEFINTRDNLAATFKYDGIAYYVNVSSQPGEVPLYRFFNRKNGVHFYTASEAERSRVIATLANLYTYEGVAYSVRIDGVGTPVYRFYVPARNTHFYTADTSEITASSGLSNYYHYEGVAYYVGARRPFW